MKKHTSHFNSLTRRSFIFGTAAVSAAALLPSWSAFASPAPIDSFLKVSSILSGIPLDKSYIQLGDRIWQTLTRKASDKDMAQWHVLLAELKTLPHDASQEDILAKLSPLEDTIMEKAKLLTKVWYTGRIKQVDNCRLPKNLDKCEVIDYDDALVWQACDFTKPPVTCGGQFGYWHKPYEGGSQYGL